MTFVDSNVFIYAVDKAVSAKQKKARGIVADVFADGSAYRVSSQGRSGGREARATR